MSDVQLNCTVAHCGRPQRSTRGGSICVSGHGGAPGKCPSCSEVYTDVAHCPSCSNTVTGNSIISDSECKCNIGDWWHECPLGEIHPVPLTDEITLDVRAELHRLEVGHTFTYYTVAMHNEQGVWEEAFTTPDQLQGFYRGIQATMSMLGKHTMKLFCIPRTRACFSTARREVSA